MKNYVVVPGPRHAGLFSYVLQALHVLSLADKTGDKVYIKYNKDMLYLDPKLGGNVWDYYFHQPFNFTKEEILKNGKEEVIFIDNKDAINFHAIPRPNEDEINVARDLCKKYLKASFVAPDDKSIKENNFDLILESVGFDVTRHQAIKSISPGGTIVHIGLTQSSGTFDFKKLTIQEVTLVGTYCYTNDDFKKSINILDEKKLGDLGWIEYRDLKKGSDAFKEIHNGTCVAPKIILLP